MGRRAAPAGLLAGLLCAIWLGGCGRPGGSEGARARVTVSPQSRFAVPSPITAVRATPPRLVDFVAPGAFALRRPIDWPETRVVLDGFGDAWIFIDPADLGMAGSGASLSVYRGNAPEPDRAAQTLESALVRLSSAGLFDPDLAPRAAARPAVIGGQPALEQEFGSGGARPEPAAAGTGDGDGGDGTGAGNSAPDGPDSQDGADPRASVAPRAGSISPERRVLIRVAQDEVGAVRGIAFEAEAAAWQAWAPLRATLMNSFDPWSTRGEP